MTTTLLLSAFDVPVRQLILAQLERSELSSMTIYASTSYDKHKLIEFISNNESICSQTEITIKHHGTF